MPPKRRSHVDGAIRSAATSVPTTMAIANAIVTRRTVTQNPELNSEKWSDSTSNSASGGTARRLVLLHQIDGLRDRDGRRIGGLLRVAADPALVQLLPGAVVLEAREDLVDERHHLRLALLDPGAVGLLRELLADELERVVLDQHAGEDHVVGGDRVDGAVLQRLEALRVGVHERQLGVGRLLLEVRLVGRAERRADLLAAQVLDARDVR